MRVLRCGNLKKMIVKPLDIVLFSTYFLLLFFSIFWLLVLFFSNEEKEKKKITKKPFFTTIVPAYNEEESILKTLKSLIELDYPKEKREIIVINDGSTDKTKSLVESFIEENPQQSITLINKKNEGKGRAMNIGIEKAKGEFFACLDADSFVSSDALNKMLPHFENENVAAVCPLLKVKKPSSVIEKIQWFEYIVNMFYRYLNYKVDCIHVTPGPFSIYRKKVIDKLGGFNEETITEDLEIAIRLQKHHYKIVHTFNATVETVTPKDWKSLFKQRVRWYKGSIDNAISYRKMMFNKDYGDFGYLRMPTIVLSGCIAIILFLTLMQDLGSKMIDWFYGLKSINFDIITLIRNFSFEFNVLNLPYAKLFIAATLFAISIFIMIYSYRIIGEKLTKHGRTFVSLVTYILIYGVFITCVWIYIAFLFVSKKRVRWS